MEKRKKRCGDRNDAYRVRGLDGMHVLMPYFMVRRTENEAVLTEKVDLNAINAFLQEKNYDGIDFKYTFFHVICAAISKMIALRPKMNYFIKAKHYYERKDIVLSFTAKKKFEDNAEEFLVKVVLDKESEISPLNQVYTKIKKSVTENRSGTGKSIADTMDSFRKMPRWLLNLVFWFLGRLDYHGHYPKSLRDTDPDFSSCFITNLGSIKMHANYHHLSEWGTNSFFVVINEKKKENYIDEKGKVKEREFLEIGATIDERIADGYYFAGSLKLLRHLLQNPYLLDQPITSPVEVDDKIFNYTPYVKSTKNKKENRA